MSDLYRLLRWLTEVRYDSIDLLLIVAVVIAATFGILPFIVTLALTLIAAFILFIVRSAIETEDDRAERLGR